MQVQCTVKLSDQSLSPPSVTTMMMWRPSLDDAPGGNVHAIITDNANVVLPTYFHLYSVWYSIFIQRRLVFEGFWQQPHLSTHTTLTFSRTLAMAWPMMTLLRKYRYQRHVPRSFELLLMEVWNMLTRQEEPISIIVTLMNEADLNFLHFSFNISWATA